VTIDPRDASQVAAAVATWATARFDGPVAVAGEPAPIGDGFDSFIHAIALQGEVLPEGWHGPLVARLLPSPDRAPQAHREADVQGWAATAGYPAPRVLAVIDPDGGLGLPTQVMERAPGTTLVQAMTRRPWQIRRLVDRLAGLARQLHALPVDGWPGPSGPTGLVDQRLGLPRLAAARLGSPVLDAALGRAEEVAAGAMRGPHVVCHGDFHPLNVVVDGPQAAVIDWSDAGLGPREADVARTALLFNVAAVAASSRAERMALTWLGPRLERWYRSSYGGGAPLDQDLMIRWEVLHLVHATAQIEMLAAGGFDGQTSADASRLPPDLSDFLAGRLAAALAAL
jgi:aminoglycoside phosphotransferase (APT) family kinase protein